MLIIKNTIFLGKNLIVEDEDIAYLCEYIPTHFYKGSDDRSRKFILDFKNGNSKMISLACEQIVNNLIIQNMNKSILFYEQIVNFI